jgi:hypothetical protein
VGFGEVRLGHGGSSCNWGGRPRGFLDCEGRRERAVVGWVRQD